MQKEIKPAEGHENLTDKQIFTQIWKSPRKVFRYINDNQYDRYVYLLLAIAGISMALIGRWTETSVIPCPYGASLDLVLL